VAAARSGDARLFVWRGLGDWYVEAASVEIGADGLAASGTQIGSDPVLYRLDYELAASADFITRALDVTASGQGWSRRVSLRHDGAGEWTCGARSEGDVDLSAPGCDAGVLRGALDCDLGRSPLTNVMPIRRRALDRRAAAEDFTMAWVSVPDLAVVRSAQRYEHVRRAADGSSVVRYVDRGQFDGFTAELELDAEGFVVVYPELAERVSGPRHPVGCE
jgi:hypothetical protein